MTLDLSPVALVGGVNKADVLAKSDELRVQSLAAAVVWKLAESSALAQLPFKTLVPALLSATVAEHSVVSSFADDSPAQSEESARRLAEGLQLQRCSKELEGGAEEARKLAGFLTRL